MKCVQCQADITKWNMDPTMLVYCGDCTQKMCQAYEEIAEAKDHDTQERYRKKAYWTKRKRRNK